MKHNLNDIIKFKKDEIFIGRVIIINNFGYGVELETSSKHKQVVIDTFYFNLWKNTKGFQFISDIIGKKIYPLWVYDYNIISNNEELKEDNAGLNLL